MRKYRLALHLLLSCLVQKGVLWLNEEKCTDIVLEKNPALKLEFLQGRKKSVVSHRVHVWYLKYESCPPLFVTKRRANALGCCTIGERLLALHPVNSHPSHNNSLSHHAVGTAPCEQPPLSQQLAESSDCGRGNSWINRHHQSTETGSDNSKKKSIWVVAGARMTLAEANLPTTKSRDCLILDI